MGRKVKVHDFGPTRLARGSTRFSIAVEVERRTHSKGKAFMACAWLRRKASPKGRGRPMNDRSGCAFGPAPRRAVANALKQLASTMAKRSSAFRGTR